MSEREHDEQQGDGETPRKTVRRKKVRREQRPAKPASSGNRPMPQTRRPSVPDERACLDALNQLPGLVVMNHITTAQANSIRGVYSTILQHGRQARSGREQPQLDDADVSEILRTNPDLLNALSPLLTDEQVDRLMKDAGDNDDGEHA